MSIESLNYGDGTFVCGFWFVNESTSSQFKAFGEDSCGKDEGYEALK